MKPDFTEVWTSVEAENWISGFEFHGPGWYVSDEGAILVVPVNRPVAKWWNKRCDEGEKFWFYLYRSGDVGEKFNAITNAPTRVDTRNDLPEERNDDG